MSVNRTIVEAPPYDEFASQFAEAAKSVAYGEPSAEGTVVRPVVNDSQLAGLKQKIVWAKEAGARVIVEVEISGRVVPPHVFADVAPDMEIAREEIFGPMVAILRPKTRLTHFNWPTTTSSVFRARRRADHRWPPVQ